MEQLENYITFRAFRVMEDTTLKNFCKEYNLVEQFCVVESKQLKQGDIIIAKNLDKKLHIVLPLENLESIARKHNTTVEYIKQLNNIDNIFIGQQLLI